MNENELMVELDDGTQIEAVSKEYYERMLAEKISVARDEAIKEEQERLKVENEAINKEKEYIARTKSEAIGMKKNVDNVVNEKDEELKLMREKLEGFEKNMQEKEKESYLSLMGINESNREEFEKEFANINSSLPLVERVQKASKLMSLELQPVQETRYPTNFGRLDSSHQPTPKQKEEVNEETKKFLQSISSNLYNN